MTRSLAFLFALTALLTGGYVHGLYSERWRTSNELEFGIERLPTVPLEIDGWKAEEIESNQAEFDLAGARGYWSRIYRKDGQEILAILMVGRAGRMSVHTPEVCYRGAGYELFGPPVPHDVGEPDAALGRFWTANFMKPSAAGAELQLDWGWNCGHGWQAPASPRWEFAGRPALYKLYLSRSSAGGNTATQTAIMDGFLRRFVPALNAAFDAALDRS